MAEGESQDLRTIAKTLAKDGDMNDQHNTAELLANSETITKHDFFVGCALIGFLARTDDVFSVQACDAILQADEVIRQLSENPRE